jgi:hypothetical protein
MATAARKSGSPGAGAGTPSATSIVDRARVRIDALAEQGLARVGALAEERKEAAAKTLDNVVDVIQNVADAAGDEFGDRVGLTVRRGSDTVANLAQSLRENSVEDMLSGTRAAIIRRPGIALGVASLVGVVGGRTLKAALARNAAGRGKQPSQHGKVAA